MGMGVGGGNGDGRGGSGNIFFECFYYIVSASKCRDNDTDERYTCFQSRNPVISKNDETSSSNAKKFAKALPSHPR